MNSPKFDDARAYLKGILDIMAKTEAELVARLDELKDQKSYVEKAMSALSILEHLPKEKDE